MRVSLKSVFAGLALGAIGLSASAAPVAVTSTVPESGFVGLQTGGAYPLTGSPYNFAGQVNSFANVTSIDSLTVTLQVSDGDSAPGDFDENALHLALDGIDTGLVLNGFPNNANLSLTLNTIALPTQLALIAALQDGVLVGSVLDTTLGNGPAGDTIAFPNLVDTTLDLTLNGPNLAVPGGGGNPVPLPAALLLAPVGAGLAGMYSRRFRRTK
jgi:hypothetical protein